MCEFRIFNSAAVINAKQGTQPRKMNKRKENNKQVVLKAVSDSVSGSLIAVYKVCSNEREEWNQEEQSTKNMKGTKGRSKRDHSGV